MKQEPKWQVFINEQEKDGQNFTLDVKDRYGKRIEILSKKEDKFLIGRTFDSKEKVEEGRGRLQKYLDLLAYQGKNPQTKVKAEYLMASCDISDEANKRTEKELEKYR